MKTEGIKPKRSRGSPISSLLYELGDFLADKDVIPPTFAFSIIVGGMIGLGVGGYQGAGQAVRTQAEVASDKKALAKLSEDCRTSVVTGGRVGFLETKELISALKPYSLCQGKSSAAIDSSIDTAQRLRDDEKEDRKIYADEGQGRLENTLRGAGDGMLIGTITGVSLPVTLAFSFLISGMLVEEYGTRKRRQDS